MWETVVGVVVMVGLFSLLLGGMLFVTRNDAEDFDPGDLQPARPLPASIVVERKSRGGTPRGRLSGAGPRP